MSLLIAFVCGATVTALAACGTLVLLVRDVRRLFRGGGI